MKTGILLKAGYHVEVISWENDGDNYRTHRHHVDTLTEARGIQLLCNTFMKNEGDVDETSNEQLHDYYDERRPLYEQKCTMEEFADYVRDLSHSIVGSTDGGLSRVCESCEIYHCPQDLTRNLITFEAE